MSDVVTEDRGDGGAAPTGWRRAGRWAVNLLALVIFPKMWFMLTGGADPWGNWITYVFVAGTSAAMLVFWTLTARRGA